MGAGGETRVLKEGLKAGKEVRVSAVPVARVFLTSVDVVTILIVSSSSDELQWKLRRLGTSSVPPALRSCGTWCA